MSGVKTNSSAEDSRNSASSEFPSSKDSTWSEDTVAETEPRPSFSLRARFASTKAKKQNSSRDDEGQDGVRGSLGLRLIHLSPDPLIDIVFVHGLRGGSIKTWRKGNDPRNFWPKEWLPSEPGLGNANIHSFGYESDWASTKSSILSVHDFGQSLLEEMRNSPYLLCDKNVSLVVSFRIAFSDRVSYRGQSCWSDIPWGAW